MRARRGYYAPEAADTPSPSAQSADGLSADAHEALRLPLSMTGLSVDLFAAPFRGTAGNAAVLLGAQISGTDLVLGPRETLEVAYRAMNTEGRTTPGRFTRFELNLQPASRTSAATTGLRFASRSRSRRAVPVRFAVNQANGKTGMVTADIDVPNFSEAPVSLSGIVLSSERTAPHHTLKGNEALKKVLGGEPTAVRRFSRGDVLTTYAEECTRIRRDNPSDLTGSITREGETQAESVLLRSVVTERGRTGFTSRIPLSGLQPGEYMLTVDARAGRKYRDARCGLYGRRELGFAVRKEMRLHEVVDRRLGSGIHLRELQAHADAAIAPRDARFGVDVLLRAGNPEARRTTEPTSSGFVVRIATPPWLTFSVRDVEMVLPKR